MKYAGHVRKTRSGRNSLVFGILFTLATFLILTVIASLVLSKTKDPLGKSGLAAILVLLLCGAISGFFTAKYKGAHAVFPVAISSLTLAIPLLFCGIFITGGRYSLISAINLTLFVAVSCLFAALATGKKRKLRRR